MMHPKEKAAQLYEKYKFVYIQNYTSSHEVKDCIYIMIYEIINCLDNLNNEQPYTIKYWEEVKSEVEKLKD